MLFHSTQQNNMINRLHPLTKVLILVTTAVVVFMVDRLAFLGAYLLAVLAIVVVCRIRFGRALVLLKLFAVGIPMLMAVFVLSYLWKEPTYTMGCVRGIHEGLRYSLRFLNLILVNFMVVLSTDPREIFYTFKLLKFPDTVSQVMAHVINLFPRLLQEIQTIVETQKLRGMQWRNMWRPSNWMPLALPVMLATMRYSEQTAISLELRGGLDPSPSTRRLFRGTDWIVLILCILLMAAAAMQYHPPAG